MKTIVIRSGVAVMLLMLCSCYTIESVKIPNTSINADVQELASLLEGSWSNMKQASRDTEFFETELHVVPIWKSRTDGLWMYVEFQLSRSPQQPYDQDIVRLCTDPRGKPISIHFKIRNDPEQYFGAWRNPKLLNAINPSFLVPDYGCSEHWHRNGSSFAGATMADTCATSHGQGAYKTNEIHVDATQLTIWTRGYNQEGSQQWGPTTGPMLFERTTTP